ncbi:inactive polyglycylase TTLL10 isoform X2 [Notolabrus celidotus]|uniref:inactive polyglycylase TTLL10 isoform X2 n=1 Tax=Notolabrus celidotus TaxID=1203425 RepID=UPI0014902EC9|nr:inactive polyglycylase TTLL10 isoform X2 [Notolabrus celidotus]
MSRFPRSLAAYVCDVGVEGGAKTDTNRRFLTGALKMPHTANYQQYQVIEVMSSDCWVESCSEDSAEQTGLKKPQEEEEEAEEEEVEVPCGQNQSACSLRQEETGGEQPLSHDHRSKQEVTSEGELEQSQREETLRFSHMTASQEMQQRGSGARRVRGNLRRSFPRGFSTCSYPDKDRVRRIEEPRGLGSFYYFGGANGAEISLCDSSRSVTDFLWDSFRVSAYCESRGWKRIHNKHREDFKLKWCETKSPPNYCNFREGEQLLYQIPNNKVLTTKIGLLSSLREYERVSSKVNHGQGLRRLKMDEFIPTTFRMDLREEREAFFAQEEGVSSKEGHMWICKPTGLNQGRGIFLLKSQEDVVAFRLKLQQTEEHQASRKTLHRQPQARIVQHYIQRPLLLKGKKFDVRSFLLIACTAPYMVFFRHGYVRLTCDLYDPTSNNLIAHLTNQYMQKKSPLYSQLKEDTVWSMESFNTYVNDRFQVAKGLPRDWVLGVFARRMQQIMTQCFFAVKSKLDRRLGLFDLIGCDFMVDEDFKVWLLEMNCNPALHTNCEVLKEVLPGTVGEALDLTLEIFNKRRLGQTILPLHSQREFVLLYSGVFPPDSVLPCRKGNISNGFNLKSTQKTSLRRCKSRTEGKSVPSASSDSPLNVTESLKGESRSKSSTAALYLNQSPQSPQVSPHSNNSSNTETVKLKKPRPRFELKLSKCTFPPRLKNAGDAEEKTRVIVPLSSPIISEDFSTCESPQTTVLMSHPQSGSPTASEDLERDEECGEENLGEDTQG